MRKRMVALSCCIGMCMLMAACGTKLDVQENTIALQRNGKILEAAVETFDQSYYKEDELNSYIQNAVDDYTAEHGKKSVSVTESKVEEKKAYLTLQYENAETFQDFSGIECFSGSIVEAQSAGYDFEQDFYPVTDGKADKKTVRGSSLLEDDDLKVLIVKENSDLIVPGKIAYVSTEGTEVTSEKQVNVTQKQQDTDESVLVYVLYR
ncbi:MAG: hypothetical protein KHY81_10060 [Lachnospiraceae bacterium]|jgi:hypothetical protein|uniref:hypothetical protein n=1 Tax=Clostridia TaxID=186801 RepID=UPI000D647F4A|nr:MULTISPECIES: hypothetical protein [Clostridia]MBS5191788.1 hypothetical protein [Lachnospiraceae bacterium]RHV71696.1 hypothetical protein DXB15_03525 [Roseburia sp. OM02-15]